MKSIQKIHSFALAALVGVPLAVGCSSSSPGTGNIAGVQAGGAGAGGTPVSPGGTTSAAGQMDTGGIPIPTAGSTGGSISSGGDTLAGGAGASGGDTVVGGSLAGGTVAKGGSIVSGGNTVGGGSTSVPGGTTKAGGSVAPAGTTAAGGTAPGGTTTASGGVVTGGATGGGGVTVLPPLTGRVRTIMPLDKSWLFNKGDASGADGATFADSGWKPVNLPHDWAIEGPFDSGAATTGRGAYVPSGIGWYRNHFTLPASVTSGQQVYVEFDGVMGNSTAYINGTQLGTHPYGYVSFRYDMTKSIKVGTANVIAVKTDTSSQPASRFYAGAGIYRHVRVIATDPVHIDQYATYVTTPSPTTASATAHVTTTVVNSGTTSQSVGVQGTVSDATGTALPAVAAPAQTIAAGASASFTFDIPVASPKLWSLETPNMYQLLTVVQVGGKAVDDDVTPFGIRDLKFSTGMTLNGKSVKFKGVCLHQDYHGLGLAAPARAMQRRLAALKAIGANAIRTAHDPPSPQFLDLCDRMGFLVLDEFTDVWTAHKYQDTGDYATYFNKASTTPTGMPALPSAATSAKWWEVDFTGWIMRDRNHPSVALYSMGNEIHDSINTRTPILTEMVKISHALDPSRYDTQALLDPSTSGDVGGATNTLLDVWGTNYNTAVAISAAAATITKSGLLTEKGADTSTWTSDVMGNAALTGEFIWTGVDYLGEVNGGWPSMGGNGALLDELGTPRSGGVTWSGLWGGTVKSVPSSGASAGKVTLTADHTTITNDLDDVAFVRAAVSSDTAVTFAITGPGTIIAVDSGSSQQQTFRGLTRTSTGGLAFAIVQATGTGSITVTATASGLTAGTATITVTDGPWVPCSGTCD
jgi:beta-galactosidase